MDPRRQNRNSRAPAPIGGNKGTSMNSSRPYVKLDRITQIPSPFHHSVPSPYSRRMPARHGPSPMQIVASPYQIFSPRHQQGFPGLPPVPPYPFHNMDLTPRRRQGPVTRSKSAVRPQNKQSRLSIKPTSRPQLSARLSLAPSTSRQEKQPKPVDTKQAKPSEKQTKAAEKQAKASEKVTKPAEKSKRESLRPDPARRRSLAPLVRSGTDFIERNKMNAGRRKSVDPSTLKEMKATRRQSLARAVKTVRTEQSVEPVEILVDEPQKVEDVVTLESNDQATAEEKTSEAAMDLETKENVPDNVLDAPSPKRAKLDNSEASEETSKSPKQTTSLFLQYLDIKKEDLPDIVADYDTQAAPQLTKENKKSRCAIM